MKKHSSKNTSDFYNELVKGKNKFTFFSNETRFNIENILHKENLIKYFDNKIKSHISDNLNILDYGCGPGTFLMKLNKLSNSNLYGVDISDEFIEQSINNFKKYNINNIKVQKVEQVRSTSTIRQTSSLSILLKTLSISSSVGVCPSLRSSCSVHGQEHDQGNKHNERKTQKYCSAMSYSDTSPY